MQMQRISEVFCCLCQCLLVRAISRATLIGICCEYDWECMSVNARLVLLSDVMMLIVMKEGEVKCPAAGCRSAALGYVYEIGELKAQDSTACTCCASLTMVA